MATRLPASMRTRDELVKLATRLVVEEALEGEAGDAVGREYYAHGARPGQGYRNGIRPGRMKTAEGFIEYSAPQIAGRDEPFRSAIREHLKGHTQALEDLAIEMLARGLSVRDIEDAFKDESGRLLLSRTAVSELGARLWEDYQAFAKRDLSEFEPSTRYSRGASAASSVASRATRSCSARSSACSMGAARNTRSSTATRQTPLRGCVPLLPSHILDRLMDLDST